MSGAEGTEKPRQREIEALSDFANASIVFPVLKRHTGVLVHVDFPHRACTCGWDWPEGARVRTDPAVADRLDDAISAWSAAAWSEFDLIGRGRGQ